MTDYLDHKLIKDAYKDDWVCSVCNIRLEAAGPYYFLITNFVSSILPGGTNEVYKMTCAETVIKNLLE